MKNKIVENKPAEPTMNRAFFDEQSGRCRLGGYKCVGPDCRKCNAPLIMKEELREGGRKYLEAQEAQQEGPKVIINEGGDLPQVAE